MYLILYLTLFLAGIYLWKRNNDRDFLWYLLPIAMLFLLTVFEQLSESFLKLSEDQRVIEYFIVTALRIVAGISIIILLFKNTYINSR